MIVCIAEKPSVAKDIARIIGATSARDGYMEGNGYQQCKALIAIAEGGLFGKGPGCGSLLKVFASDTDIVFSTICEEW